MAHFYFNFRSSRNLVLDEEGLDLHDIDTAREEALASVRKVFANAIEAGSVLPPYTIIIIDASGREVATIANNDVLQS